VPPTTRRCPHPGGTDSHRRDRTRPEPPVIPYTAYKVVHYLGIFLLLTGLSAALARAAAWRVSDVAPPEADPWGRRIVIAHGIALFMILLGGFGMLARLEITEGLGLPGWIWAKLGLWTILGGVVAIRRVPALAGPALVVAPLLAALAGWVALYKPI